MKRVEMVGDVEIVSHVIRTSRVVRDGAGMKLGRSTTSRTVYFACKGGRDVPARDLDHARQIAQTM